MSRYNDGCLDVDTDFDVLLWALSRATIRRPDAALFACAPPDLRPLPASMVKLVVEVVSPGTERVDTADKMAEYALAGIPWYWIVHLADNDVAVIETFVLDHVLNQYRPHQTLEHTDGVAEIDLPIAVKLDWSRLTGLAR